MPEVELAGGGRQVAPTFPVIDAQQLVNDGGPTCPEGGKLHRLVHSSMPNDIPTPSIVPLFVIIQSYSDAKLRPNGSSTFYREK